MNNYEVFIWNMIVYGITEEPLTHRQVKELSSWTLFLTQVWNASSVMLPVIDYYRWFSGSVKNHVENIILIDSLLS